MHLRLNQIDLCIEANTMKNPVILLMQQQTRFVSVFTALFLRFLASDLQCLSCFLCFSIFNKSKHRY